MSKLEKPTIYWPLLSESCFITTSSITEGVAVSMIRRVADQHTEIDNHWLATKNEKGILQIIAISNLKFVFEPIKSAVSS
ncbi:3032_t:CDS:2, partial [Funneliformis caledonium]